jgi:hypothetical protein
MGIPPDLTISLRQFGGAAKRGCGSLFTLAPRCGLRLQREPAKDSRHCMSKEPEA